MNSKNSTMIELAPHNLCTGCTSCANTCPHHAITMQADGEGFLYPAIDRNLCVECGLCTKRCPILLPEQQKNESSPKAFALWSYPDRTVSSSGGAFSAFARSVIKKGGRVWGAAFVGKLKCRHVESDSLDGLAALRGSKYVQSDLGSVFSLIKEELQQGIQVLFCGTPCQVAGLQAYLHKGYDNLLTLDLACHGVPSDAILQAYIKKLSVKKGINIDKFEFRRLNGWGKAPAVEIRGKLCPIYGIDDLYMRAFDRSALFRLSCYSCPYARLPRLGDCTIADFWGIGRHGKPFKQNVLKGVSLVLANNKKGEKAVSQLENVFMEQRTLEEALIENHNITHPSLRHPQRNLIIHAFLNPNKTLDEIAVEFNLIDKSLKGQIKELASKWHVFDLVKSVYNKYKSL